MLYEYQLGHAARETERNTCRAIGASTVSYVTASRWLRRFACGDYSIEDEPRFGRPLELIRVR